MKLDPAAAAFTASAAWLVSSGIQSQSGGVHAWYDLSDGRRAFLYSEITGYAISAFLFLAELTRDDAWLERARHAAGWLRQEVVDDRGVVLTRRYGAKDEPDPTYSFTEGNCFSFDAGMVLGGLASLHRRTGDEGALDAACRIAQFLLERMQRADGSFAAAIHAPSGRVIDDHRKWSSEPGAFHAKIALGLIDLFEATSERRYRDAAIAICEFALHCQQEDGRFVTQAASGTTHLHPHCYAAEGLYFTGRRLAIPAFRAAADRALLWALGRVTETGVPPLHGADGKPMAEPERSDVVAQIVRLGMLTGKRDALGALIVRLLSYQYRAGDPRHRGGQHYALNGPHLNAWCTMFAMQAFALAAGLAGTDGDLRPFV